MPAGLSCPALTVLQDAANISRMKHRAGGFRSAGLALAALLATGARAQMPLLDLDEPARPRTMPAGAQAPAAPTGLPSIRHPLSGQVVPAFGSQRILPQVPPVQVTTQAIDLLATPGEFESAAFVLRAASDIARLVLTPGDLASAAGRLPAAQIDLRLVKCWYQAGNAWFTDAGDPDRAELVPELLLHDDALVVCNRATRQNQVRIQGQLAPLTGDASPAAGVHPDDDAATLQPLALRAGAHQQFWLTIHVPEATPAGLYRGSVTLEADGRGAGDIAVTLRVLPFVLPPARPRHDATRTFQVILAHGLSLDGGPAAEARLRAAFADMARHQVLHPLAPDFSRPEQAARELAWRREAGLPDAPLWLADPLTVPAWRSAAPAGRAAAPDLAGWASIVAVAARLAGHRELFIHLPAGSEPPAALAAPLASFKTATGARLWMHGSEAGINDYGYLIDAHQYGAPATPRQIETRQRVGSRVIWGGTPAPGVENPEVWRRLTGLVPYLNGYDGVTIAGFSEAEHPWSDTARGFTRSRSLVYPTTSGWIGTLAWEAVREAIDDVRTFTLLNDLIAQCRAAPERLVVIEGRRAALWLHRAEAARANLDTLRLDAIAWILKLRAALATLETKEEP